MSASVSYHRAHRYGCTVSDGPTINGGRAETASVNNSRHELELPIRETRSDHPFALDNPVNPHMSDLQTRLQTFRFGNQWPGSRVRATPQDIAKAGLFYLGERDRVKCWYCNGGLQNWERDDDPWIEHAKWFPRCSFVLREMGSDCVQAISSQFPNLNRPSMPVLDIQPAIRFNGGVESRHPASPAIIDPREEERKRERLVQTEMEGSTIVKQAREMGFESMHIRQALTRRHQETDQGFATLEQLLDALASATSAQDSNSAIAEVAANGSERNEARGSSAEEQILRMERERKCKICRDEKSSVVFVPCGHLAACTTCSTRAQTCPTCGSYVREKIKAFLV